MQSCNTEVLARRRQEEEELAKCFSMPLPAEVFNTKTFYCFTSSFYPVSECHKQFTESIKDGSTYFFLLTPYAEYEGQECSQSRSEMMITWSSYTAACSCTTGAACSIPAIQL
jgi:hypothetical protein